MSILFTSFGYRIYSFQGTRFSQIVEMINLIWRFGFVFRIKGILVVLVWLYFKGVLLFFVANNIDNNIWLIISVEPILLLINIFYVINVLNKFNYYRRSCFYDWLTISTRNFFGGVLNCRSRGGVLLLRPTTMHLSLQENSQ